MIIIIMSSLTTWIIEPPYGCRFVNERGNEVSLQFEEGRETEVLQSVMMQLQNHMRTHIATQQKKAEEAARLAKLATEQPVKTLTGQPTNAVTPALNEGNNG
jgi:hypothetical protein